MAIKRKSVPFFAIIENSTGKFIDIGDKPISSDVDKIYDAIESVGKSRPPRSCSVVSGYYEFDHELTALMNYMDAICIEREEYKPASKRRRRRS